MNLTSYLHKKLNDEMRIIYITETKPKQKIRLNPIDPQDLNVDLHSVSNWSRNNHELYQLILENGMAQYICNRQFLHQFYAHLQFMYSGISVIDPIAHKLINISVLNLFNNDIRVLENIPPNCKELYMDFNQIESCSLKNVLKVELLSISHNYISNQCCDRLLDKMPELRCLNISYNRIQDIRSFICDLRKCKKLKMLNSFENPISLLWLYWEFMTEEIALDYFDGEKYVKPEPIVQQPIVEQKPPEVKPDKKDSKNAKKGAKVEQKPVEPAPEPIKLPQPPRQKQQQDYRQSNLRIQITEFEGFTGNIYEPSLFPGEQIDPRSTQTCFWIEVNALHQQESTYQSRINMQEVTTEQQTNRLSFKYSQLQTVKSQYENYLKFNEGVTVYVWKIEPVVNTNAETGEQKACLGQSNEPIMQKSCIGGTYVDLRHLHRLKHKKNEKNHTIFPHQAVASPLFSNPYQNEKKLIDKYRIEFDSKLAQQEEQKLKKLQQQKAEKTQKKGGKDTKKANEKKGTKKDSKQPVSDKVKVEKSNFAVSQKQYCCLDQHKMYKCLKDQLLAIRVILQ